MPGRAPWDFYLSPDYQFIYKLEGVFESNLVFDTFLLIKPNLIIIIFMYAPPPSLLEGYKVDVTFLWQILTPPRGPTPLLSADSTSLGNNFCVKNVTSA